MGVGVAVGVGVGGRGVEVGVGNGVEVGCGGMSVGVAVGRGIVVGVGVEAGLQPGRKRPARARRIRKKGFLIIVDLWPMWPNFPAPLVLFPLNFRCSTKYSTNRPVVSTAISFAAGRFGIPRQTRSLAFLLPAECATG